MARSVAIHLQRCDLDAFDPVCRQDTVGLFHTRRRQRQLLMDSRPCTFGAQQNPAYKRLVRRLSPDHGFVTSRGSWHWRRFRDCGLTNPSARQNLGLGRSPLSHRGRVPRARTFLSPAKDAARAAAGETPQVDNPPADRCSQECDRSDPPAIGRSAAGQCPDGPAMSIIRAGSEGTPANHDPRADAFVTRSSALWRSVG